MFDTSDILLRWSIGEQDTTTLNDYESQKRLNFLWLAKLSIASFQRWFPAARFVLLYNGNKFREFRNDFQAIDLELFCDIDYIDQLACLNEGSIVNPYHFRPRGVWWKWVPFRLDVNKHEIAIDTDIVCLNSPTSWLKWLNSEQEILVAPERYEKVLKNTCGDFYNHPLLKGKTPFNCGVVGHRKGRDFSPNFFEITENMILGENHDSLFINEQGAINLWVRSLEINHVTHCVLDFYKNAWMRDFLFFLNNGIEVETVHAVSWYKTLVYSLRECFVKKVFNDGYTYTSFVKDILRESKNLDPVSKTVIERQFYDRLTGRDFLILG